MTQNTTEMVIWDSGAYVRKDLNLLPAGCHGLHYGTGVFEGIRAYEGDNGKPVIFKLRQHLERFRASADALNLVFSYDTEELADACYGVVRRNGLGNAYLRPIAVMSEGFEMMAKATGAARVFILALPYAGLTSDLVSLNAHISPFIKPSANSALYKAKMTGHYSLVAAAARQAATAGCQQAIFLDENNHVTEALTDNLFMVKDGLVLTPPKAAPILEGITRQTVMDALSRDGYAVEETAITAAALQEADEIFITSTAGGVRALPALNGATIGSGDAGPITHRAHALYNETVGHFLSSNAP